ncbi:g1623 [Coccomyxa elongata]
MVGQQLVGHIVDGTENVLSRAEKKIQSLFPPKQTSSSTQPAATTTLSLKQTHAYFPAFVSSGVASTTGQASTPPPTTPAASTTTSSSSTPPSTTVAASTPPQTNQAATTQPPTTVPLPGAQPQSFPLSQMPDYTVLAAGGANFADGILNSSELYTSTTGNWTATGAMTTPRALFNMVRLPDGEALLAGGVNMGGEWGGQPGHEHHRAVQRHLRLLGIDRRDDHATDVHADGGPPKGDVLAAGGCVDPTDDTRCDTQASAEVFSPGTGAWATTGSMSTPQRYFQMVALLDGTALAAGGNAVFADGGGYETVFLNSSEIYEPVTGNWTTTGSMSTPRSDFQMVLPPDG